MYVIVHLYVNGPQVQVEVSESIWRATIKKIVQTQISHFEL